MCVISQILMILLPSKKEPILRPIFTIKSRPYSLPGMNLMPFVPKSFLLVNYIIKNSK